ncbi:MAG: electron transfer flavoprotein subunit alpha/FixB family protein [Cytophagales bacterium]
MSILVYLEIADGKVKKSSLEVAAYAAALAQKMQTEAVGLAIGKASDLDLAGNYGLHKVLNANTDNDSAQAYASIVMQAATHAGSSIIILPKSASVDGFASRLSVKMNANMVSNVAELPDVSAGFKVKRSIYTGKAFAWVEMKTANKILVVKKNAFTPTLTTQKAEVEAFNIVLTANDAAVKVMETIKTTGDILLTEAEIVVSGGRGLKGPENWHLIENLAKKLHAGTGCSKPVSDMDWRPHSEHVGQTGVKVSPNIYIAVGISGAIQHLAGVNSSKVIVVINKDPEAPFFKAADYGIVGDAFDILPKLAAAAGNYVN